MICRKCKKGLPDDAVFCMYCGIRQEPERKYKKRPNGTGSIVKLSGGRTKPYRATLRGVVIGYYETQKAAHAALSRLEGAPMTDSYNWTFTQVYEAWREEHYRDVTQRTREIYDHAFKVAAPLHKRKFRDLRAVDFQRILDSLDDLSESSVQKQKQLFTQMATYAVKNDICDKNYASFAVCGGRPSTPHKPMTAEEVAKIEADGSETAKIVLMLLATGARINELFQLSLADYHDTYFIGGEKTEAGKGRVIPIRPEGRPHFAYFAEKAKAVNGARLIDGYDGNRSAANFRRRDYYPLLDKLGIDRSKTPHSTRTTYGTRAATEDALSPAVLQKVMGHASFGTTQKYYNHPDADALVAAVESSVKEK